MKSLIEEFKKFILKGNVVDLAVGVMIGAAFGGIVKAFTDGIITPLLGALHGKPEVSLHLWHFDIGLVINAILNFLIMAAIIFFLIMKPVALLLAKAKKKEAAAPPAPPTPEVQLLTEIRDLLKQK
ncbi:MAG: large conductance mechanosensitive channel protein MscL [Verrucomicrobia bacterium]|nr:large conductance mechanosensitive channel protein MscL [Verrucomicrobiota bacterium]